MKNLLTCIALLACTAVNAQADDKAILQNILTNVLADSSFTHDLCTINGIPVDLSYTYQACSDQPLTIDRSHFTKQYKRTDAPGSIVVSSFKLVRKTSSDLARIELVFPDGTRSSLRAHRYARNGGRWFVTFYQLRGQSLETGAKTRILKGEI